MTDFRDIPADTRENAARYARRGAPDAADLQQLAAYWASIQGPHPVPLRRDVDPRRIGRILPDTFILERIAPGLARFRVAGTHLAELMGLDVRGMPVSALIEPAGRDAFSGALAQVFDRPARLRVQLRSKGGFGRPALDGMMAILPLRDDHGEVSRALGGIVTGRPAGRPPRRFAVIGFEAAPVLPGMDIGAGPAQPVRPHYLRLVVSR